MNVFQQTIDEVLRSLETTREGLADVEGQQRLTRFGFNELESGKSINPFLLFINQFKSFIIYILLFAVLFSILIGEYVDTTIILAILIANALIGFFQELSAHRSLEALKKMSVVKATVLRGGAKKILDARYLVPGDIVHLESGDKVPADARIIEAVRLKADESLLTGESVPTEKDSEVIDKAVPLGNRYNMLFSSTTITTGHAKAVVTATGMATELGKIASLLQEAVEEMTPLQRRLDHFGKKLGYTIIAICFLVFFLTLFRGYQAGALSIETLMGFAFIAISLAVAAVPTALPAVVTIALSIGVKRLLQRKALVRNLAAVETLGSCDVICTDKTGTLTENQMTVRRAWTGAGETSISGQGYNLDGTVSGHVLKDLFLCGSLCNNASFKAEGESVHMTGDPTEVALLVSAAKAGIASDAERIDELPFDSDRKMMSVLVKGSEKIRLYSKGAPDRILDVCSHILDAEEIKPLTPEIRERVEKQNSAYASDAMRVLGFAMRETNLDEPLTEKDLTFLGLQAMIDPPRSDVVESISRTKVAGIRVIMITGDYAKTAEAVAEEIGIEGKVIGANELEAMDDLALKKALDEGTNIFARVAPEHKLRIVDTLQKAGFTVAMTGDGVNDAPALKKANIGVAVGSGTDVAKEAADFVLLDDSFTHIVNAIEEGRGIYDNIQKSIMLLLSGNLGEVLIIFLATLFGMNLPLTAILLLWINMVTDGAPALAYSVDPYGRDIMLRPPKSRDEGILPLEKLVFLVVLGVLGTALALVLFYNFGGATSSETNLMRAQTLVFNFVVLYEVILSFVIRFDYQVALFANKWVWGAAGLAIGLQALLMYTPLALAFKILPLKPWEIVILGTAGGIFTCGALAFQTGKRLFKKGSAIAIKP